MSDEFKDRGGNEVGKSFADHWQSFRTNSASTFKVVQHESVKGFGIAYQWSMQQMGKIEPSPETPEFLESLQQLQDIYDSFAYLIKISYSVMNNNPSAKNPAQHFMDNEIRRSLELKKRYEITKLDYDARCATVSSLTHKQDRHRQLAEAITIRDEVDETLKAIKLALMNSVADLDLKKEKVHNDTVMIVCKLMQDVQPKWAAIRVTEKKETIGTFSLKSGKIEEKKVFENTSLRGSLCDVSLSDDSPGFSHTSSDQPGLGIGQVNIAQTSEKRALVDKQGERQRKPNKTDKTTSKKLFLDESFLEDGGIR